MTGRTDTPFIRWLEAVMDERGWIYKDVAEAAGVTQGAITGWLKGALPGPGSIVQLAVNSDTPVEQLFAIVHVGGEPKKGRRGRKVPKLHVVRSDAHPL